MKKSSQASSLFIFAVLIAWPIMASAESEQHTGHTQTAITETAAPAVATKDHADHKGNMMAKMSEHMEKMQKEQEKSETQMMEMQALMEKIRQMPPGEERNKRIDEHTAKMHDMLSGLRSQAAQVMKHQMMDADMPMNAENKEMPKEDQMKKEMMKGGMMKNMVKHHQVMEKRMVLLFDLLDQMINHMDSLITPR
ncbi:MAG: hypothetical protein H7832_14600 [Magnetococcus sp. DMHC-6]